jgi:hypothetical protein
VGNPWVDDSKQSGAVEGDGGFTLTDGKIAVHFTAALFKDLQD